MKHFYAACSHDCAPVEEHALKKNYTVEPSLLNQSVRKLCKCECVSNDSKPKAGIKMFIGDSFKH